MRLASIRLAIALCLMLPIGAPALAVAQEPTPITIGQSYQLTSPRYPASREVNVWLPPDYGRGDDRYPVLYLLDGGQQQDFHHISGLAQLGWINGSTRSVIVVGVASVDRRNELALPTQDPELREAWPTQGDSARFRAFLTEEVKPFIEGRFRTVGDGVLMGESLAGLFVVETFLKAPGTFDAYVAISPSLWWDGGVLANQAGGDLQQQQGRDATLILSIGDEGGAMQTAMDDLVLNLQRHAPEGIDWTYTPRPAESHATIYHGAALEAYRTLFATPAASAP